MSVRFHTLINLVKLLEVRRRMKSENLFPLGGPEVSRSKSPASEHSRTINPALAVRTYDGSENQPHAPSMGQVGQPFLRNVDPETLEGSDHMRGPDPRLVSKLLLHQREDHGQSVVHDGINLLAVAWIQFQVHDWFTHETSTSLRFECARKDVCTGDAGCGPGGARWPARIALDELDLEKTTPIDLDSPIPAFANSQGHWWDGSQIYGANRAIAKRLRKCCNGIRSAKLELRPVDDEILLPLGEPLPEHALADQETCVELSGFIRSWWLGLSLLHTVFAREHNAIVCKLRGCEQLRSLDLEEQAYEDLLFEKARLINAAVMAKIHTVEWSTALLPDEVLSLGLRLDWWGFPEDSVRSGIHEHLSHISSLENKGEVAKFAHSFEDKIRSILTELGPVFRSEPPVRRTPSAREEVVVSAGTEPPEESPGTNEARDPLHYAMSEEFTAVYRMHALLPEKLALVDKHGGRRDVPLDEARGARTKDLNEAHGLRRLFQAFGTQPAVALRLFNYPSALTKMTRDGGQLPIDLGAVDILRDRERRIPRYIEFKEAISHQRGPASPSPRKLEDFKDICGDPDEPGIGDAEKQRRERDAWMLEKVYGDARDVDLLIGMLVEPIPPGMSVSWTAFEIFLLMTPLRLNIDWFYTEGYTEEVYTKDGIEWINNATMKGVLERHYKGIKKALTGSNPFLSKSWEPL